MDHGHALQISELPSIKDKFSLKGKKAFVTGAAGGIGRSSAAAFAELGADVVIMDIPAKEEALKQYAKELEARYGTKIFPIVGNVADEESVGEMYDAIEEEFGTIDIVHSNAGVNPIYDNIGIAQKEWDRIVSINYTGSMMVARYGAEMMKAHGHGGSIIITASMSGSIINKVADNQLTQMAYCSSKAAIKHLAKAMAIAYVNDGIRVNSISPGYILSGLHDPIPKEHIDFLISTVPMQRYGRLDEIAGVIAMLASDVSTYMTGSDVIVDGGYTIW
jgi:sorbose reductase